MSFVEHDAESLQFFLWYCDYIERWSNLLPRQKALSQVWDPEKATEHQSPYITYSHNRVRSDQINKIIAIMDLEHRKAVEEAEERSLHSRNGSSSTNFSRPRASNLSTTSLSSTEHKEDQQACKT